ncbi:MAG: ribokinase [Candidatus Coatesbacteria bacterium]
MQSLCVIGSLNTDLVATVGSLPRPGQTLTGSAFHTFPGGKGANQAVALGRLGADVAMVGKVGDDAYGRTYLEVLAREHVKSDGVAVEPGVSSGIAIIEVDASGENSIVIIPGANGTVDAAFLDGRQDRMLRCDIFLLQLEIPMAATLHALRLLRNAGKTVILDPAPAMTLSDELLALPDILTPNETELEALAGTRADGPEDLPRVAGALLDRGAKSVVVKAGKHGAVLVRREGILNVPGFAVNAVDTTAAGDSFNAGLAYSLARGALLPEAVRFANAVGALSTTALGAQAAMPGLPAVERLLAAG